MTVVVTTVISNVISIGTNGSSRSGLRATVSKYRAQTQYRTKYTVNRGVLYRRGILHCFLVVNQAGGTDTDLQGMNIAF